MSNSLVKHLPVVTDLCFSDCHYCNFISSVFGLLEPYKMAQPEIWNKIHVTLSVKS